MGNNDLLCSDSRLMNTDTLLRHGEDHCDLIGYYTLRLCVPIPGEGNSGVIYQYKF